MAWPTGIPNWLKNQWGIISGAVSARFTTSQVIDSLREYAAANPGGWGPRGVIYVSELRSIAVGIRTASERITKLGFTGPIDASLIAEAPWARSAVQRALSPGYFIRALVSYTNPEFLAGVPGAPETLQKWVSHTTSLLPGELQTLTGQVASQASDSGSPPTPILGVHQMEILEE